VLCDIHDGYEYGHYIDKVKEWGVKHEYVSTYRFVNPYSDLKYLLTLYRILNREKYDMVINVATKPNVYGSIAARWAKTERVVCFGWGLGLTFEKTKNVGRLLLKYILSALYRYAFKISDKVWFTNENDLEYLASKNIIDRDKAVVTRGFVNTQQYSPSSVTKDATASLRYELGYDDNDKIVIMIARMSWAKGVEQFCQTCDRLRNSYPQVKFLLVGQEDIGSPDSVPRSYLERYQEHDNFTWLGYRVDIEELYSLAYLAVFPSYYREGGWPRGVTEPMAMGKPVITTDSEHCSNAVEDGVTGLLVPVRDSEALSEAIEHILNNEELALEFGRKSREKVVRENDEELIMTQLIEAII